MHCIIEVIWHETEMQGIVCESFQDLCMFCLGWSRSSKSHL